MRGFLASVMVVVLAACGSPNRSVGAPVTPYPAGSPDAQEVHTTLAISACSIAASLDRGRAAYQALLAAHDEGDDQEVAQRQTEIETALASADSERSALLLQREEFGVPYSEELHAFVMLTEEVARYLTEALTVVEAESWGMPAAQALDSVDSGLSLLDEASAALTPGGCSAIE